MFESSLWWSKSDKARAEVCLFLPSRVSIMFCIPSLVNTTPMLLELLHLLQYIPTYLQPALAWISVETEYLGLLVFYSRLVARR